MSVQIPSVRKAHGVAAEPVELGDHQHVAGLQSVEQAREAAALCGGDAARDGLSHDPTGLNAETSGLDFLELIIGGLARGGNANISTRCAAWAKFVRKGCPELTPRPKARIAGFRT